ncbi:MAG: M3 family metallopeptidase, partial [Alphaproteobacteria bacterium]|nr:M3 family metallopeptidase [Alphaproteobacteria bacterium]
MSCKEEFCTRSPGVQNADGGGAGAGAGAGLGDLPVWDLGDLYKSPEAPELEADLARAAEEATRLRETYRGHLTELDGAGLGAAIAAYEAIDEALTRVMSYAGLLHAADMADPEVGRFYQSMQERLTTISSGLLFFALEINRIDDAAMEEMSSDPALAAYRGWLRDTRAFRPHQLDEDLEKLAHEMSVSGSSAWVRLFDETMAALRFEVDGEPLSSEEVLDLLTDPDETRRRAGGKALGAVLAENVRLFAHITNTLAKDKETQDRWRKFARPVSSRNLSNAVEDEVVDALAGAVRDAYPKLSHRYYAIKAKWLGKRQLDYWDRNAPLPDEDSERYPWAQAVDTVLAAYDRFSPELASIGKRFFDSDWIDAPVRPGKAPGAFAHPTVPSVHPYLMLNYQGKTRDVMTLAHELGHGVHQVLAGNQGHFGSQTPLTL